jgi:5-methylcytosine-specific restriction endonuclease McrA
MATFHVGQQTHRAVLPQRHALESVSADIPGSRDETGHRRAVGASGMEHGRGETRRAAPRGGRHPDGARVPKGGRGIPAACVFVLDKHGQPLQPTRPAMARKLLKAGRAVVHRHTPLVIRMKDREAVSCRVPGVEVGIDPGSKHTGIAVFGNVDRTRTGLFSLQLDHRGGRIRNRLVARAAYRRRRRSANLRYRAPRWLDRARPDGWLAPSLRHRVETTVSWVSRLVRWAPARTLHVERAAFDTHALTVGRRLEGVEYQQGTLAGYEMREYLLEKWGRKCAYCGATHVPLNIDHIHPRSRAGSDRIANLTLACMPCNQAKSARPVEEFLAGRPEVLVRVLAQARAPLRDAAAVNATRWALWQALVAIGLPVHASSGGPDQVESIPHRGGEVAHAGCVARRPACPRDRLAGRCACRDGHRPRRVLPHPPRPIRGSPGCACHASSRSAATRPATWSGP